MGPQSTLPQTVPSLMILHGLKFVLYFPNAAFDIFLEVLEFFRSSIPKKWTF